MSRNINEIRGYYGNSYDRYVPMYDEKSKITKMKETYWTTKQVVLKKLGKKEDEHVVASDSELDAKLEVFKAIQNSSIELLRVVDKYQDRICVLSREENAMGRMLKTESDHDKTRAGKIMSAVGKAQCFSSQQMLQLRSPLVRLYQEVETFRCRAIVDTLLTIKRMEGARSEYRGALLWMKDVSNELDPDAGKQLQKFRAVQAQVKKTKSRFDKLKLDVMQKVDLLAASRCNMFSHVLAKYQSTLLHFWEKTAVRMSRVADSFKGYQYYEFNMLKELGDPSKKLAEETGGLEEEGKDLDDSFEDNSDTESGMKGSGGRRDIIERLGEGRNSLQETTNKICDDDDILKDVGSDDDMLGEAGGYKLVELLRDDDSSRDDDDVTNDSYDLVPIPLKYLRNDNNDEISNNINNNMSHRASVASNEFTDFISALPIGQCQANSQLVQQSDLYDNQQPIGENYTHDKKDHIHEAQQIKSDEQDDTIIDFGDEDDDVDLEEIRRKQDEEFHFTGMISHQETGKEEKASSKKGSIDLLVGDLQAASMGKQEDDVEMLQEILNSTPTTPNDFTSNWKSVFGAATTTSASSNDLLSPSSDHFTSFFSHQPSDNHLPSSLFQLSATDGASLNQQQGNNTLGLGLSDWLAGSNHPTTPITTDNSKPTKKTQSKKKDSKQEMSAWFNLFAELDPLANPDAIGRKSDDVTDA